MIVRPVIQYVYSEFNSDFADGITKTQIRRLFDAGQPLSIYTKSRHNRCSVSESPVLYPLLLFSFMSIF